MHYSYTLNLIQLITRHQSHTEILLYVPTLPTERGVPAAEYGMCNSLNGSQSVRFIHRWNSLSLRHATVGLIWSFLGKNWINQCGLQLETIHQAFCFVFVCNTVIWIAAFFVWFRDAEAWIGVGLDFLVGGEGSEGAAVTSGWPLWLQWKAQRAKGSLACARHSLLKLQKGRVATDGAVNNHSPTHANAHSCTNTHQCHTPCHTTGWKHTTDTHTVIKGGVGKTDGKCVMLWRSAPGGVEIPLVFQPLTSTNTSEKLWSRSSTDIHHHPLWSVSYSLTSAGSLNCLFKWQKR